jgi:hypothetical protein
MVAAALIDRLVHHATMSTLKGMSDRVRERGLDVVPSAHHESSRRARRTPKSKPQERRSRHASSRPDYHIALSGAVFGAPFTPAAS